MVTRWVHISVHRTETGGRIERGGFPQTEMLKITKTIFLTQLRKNQSISKTKTSKVGPF